MVRSAVAVLAVLILPAFAASQESPPDYTVRDGDTLWDLAARFYSDPFDWRRIWNANRDVVADPNLILPGEVLIIPDGVMADGAMPRVDVSVQESRAGRRVTGPGPITGERTIFYRDTSRTGGVVGMAERNYRVVSRGDLYSTPWLTGVEGDPRAIGTLQGLAAGDDRSETPRTYDRVSLHIDGPMPAVGSTLRTYRTTRLIDGVGQVVQPTGLVSVTDRVGDGVVAVVTQEYHRIALGDFVGPAPDYPLDEGVYPRDVMDGPRAMIVGFAGVNEVQDIGSIAFLDLGADQGIAIGDEFEYLNARAGSNVVEGRLQVVSVDPDIASARVVEMNDAVWEQGIVVRLSKKMP